MHLSVEEALDLIEKQASPDRVGFWNTHISTCSSCAAQLKAWQDFRDVLIRKSLEDAPGSVVRAAEAIFELRPAKPSIRELIASKIFDSFSQPALAGARGASATRQLLLSADDYDIHLRIWTRASHRKITGQLLSRKKDKEVKGTQVRLLQNGKRVDSAEADRFGEFEFHEVPDGPLELEIELAHLKITGDVSPG